MDDLTETLWQEFAVETDEHLVAIEPLLVRLGSAEASSEEVARLFRAFHSLKGLSRAMALYGMEAIAHRSENLLGLVRDHGVVADKVMIDALLEAVDSLKELRGAAIGDRRDRPAAPEQLQSLDQLFERARPDGGASAPAERAPEPAKPADDGSDMTQLFAELMQTRLPELAGVFGNDAAARTELVETLESLSHAAKVMEYDQLGETLSSLHDTIAAARGPLDPPTKHTVIDAVSTVLIQARLLRELLDLDTGADALAGALVHVLKPDIAIALAYLSRAIERIEEAVLDQEFARAIDDAADAEKAARDARELLQCTGAGRAAEVLLLLEDVTSRVGRGEVSLTPPLVEALAFAAHAIVHGGDRAGDLSEGQIADIEQLVRAVLHRGEEASAVPISGVRIDPDMFATLSAEQRHRLREQVAAGAQVYQLVLFLESAPVIGESLVAWLNTEATVIHSRTVLTAGQSWFDFLLLAKAPADAVRDALTGLDPGRRCIKLLRRLSDRPDGELLLDYPRGTARPAAPAERAAAETAAVIRVRSETVDAIATQVGEIRVGAAHAIEAMTESRWTEMLAQLRRRGDRLDADDASFFRDCVTQLRERQRGITELIRTLDTEVSRLQALVLELRVVPIDSVLNRLPRAVRLLAQEQGKSLRLRLEGGDVRIDKSMVERLVDPLMHMVRNAVDHGIETPEERAASGKPAEATLTIWAEQRGSEVRLKVTDDGRGLDERAIVEKAIARGIVGAAEASRLKPSDIHRFIFLAGFSTREHVTETSGRGVGMDVVLTTVHQLGGRIEVETASNEGTTFTLHFPLSAALQRTLLVELGDQVLGIPDRFVLAVAEADAANLVELGGLPAIRYDHAVIPIYPLSSLLWQADAAGAVRPSRPVVVISDGQHAIGLAVDTIRRRQELLLKDLHPFLATCRLLSGAAVLGDGRVVLLLDAGALIQGARDGARLGAAPRVSAS